MDLLQENTGPQKKGKKSRAQKIVLTLLIIAIILSIIVGVLIIVTMSNDTPVVPYSIMINDENIDTSTLQLTQDNNVKYISIRALCSKLQYSYFNGEYKTAGELKTKGYVDTTENIIQFYSNSKKIFKVNKNENLNYEYYNLKNPILSYNDNLFIAIDDLGTAFNVIENYYKKNNLTTIETPQHWIAKKSDNFKKENINISSSNGNLRALSYGYVVIEKGNSYGLISIEGNELVGTKYKSIEFCEYTKDFIVSDTSGKYGVVLNDGLPKIRLQYDSLKIINYDPFVYLVSRSNKKGIMRENGEIINEIKYDSVGYPATKEINYTLIIPTLNEDIPESIVVCKDGKYGLIDIKTGKEIISCNLNGIYSVTNNDKIYYIVENQNGTIKFLEDFFKITI